MTTTTPNMNLVLPDVLSTVGPTWATLLNSAYTLIDSHNHSSGQGVAITPSGLNISSDLTFAQNNATNLRSARLYNNSSISLGVNDKTCLYSLNNELYYVDGAGNNVQVTLGGTLNLAGGVSSLTINDSQFFLQYFGDTSRKFRFNASAIPASTTRIISVPDSGANDTMLTQAATQVLTNKTLSDTTTTIGQVSDNTKAIKFSLASATTATTATIISSQTANRNITLPDATGTVVLKDTTDDLSNKSFITTTTIKSANLLTFNNSANTFSTSLSAGANTANTTFKLPIADGSANQVLQTDGAGQLSFTTAATTTGTVAANDSNVVFTNSSNRHQSCLPTAARTYTMATTTIPQGDTWDFDNQSLFLITVNSSGGNLLGYVYPKSSTRFVALTATPTTAAHWNTIYESIVPAIVQANDAATTFVFTDNQFQISTPTATRTYLLPTTGVPAGYIFHIYNQATTAANYITLQSSGSNTITIIPPKGYVKVISAVASPTTAANWLILERYSQWVAYTPTYAAEGTPTNVSSFYRVVGDTLQVKGSLTTGVGTGVTNSITLPAGMTIDNAKLSLANTTSNPGNIIGQFVQTGAASRLNQIVTATGTSTTLVYISVNVASTTMLTPTTGGGLADSTVSALQFEVPVI